MRASLHPTSASPFLQLLGGQLRPAAAGPSPASPGPVWLRPGYPQTFLSVRRERTGEMKARSDNYPNETVDFTSLARGELDHLITLQFKQRETFITASSGGVT